MGNAVSQQEKAVVECVLSKASPKDVDTILLSAFSDFLSRGNRTERRSLQSALIENNNAHNEVSFTEVDRHNHASPSSTKKRRTILPRGMKGTSVAVTDCTTSTQDVHQTRPSKISPRLKRELQAYFNDLKDVNFTETIKSLPQIRSVWCYDQVQGRNCAPLLRLWQACDRAERGLELFSIQSIILSILLAIYGKVLLCIITYDKKNSCLTKKELKSLLFDTMSQQLSLEPVKRQILVKRISHGEKLLELGTRIGFRFLLAQNVALNHKRWIRISFDDLRNLLDHAAEHLPSQQVDDAKELDNIFLRILRDATNRSGLEEWSGISLSHLSIPTSDYIKADLKTILKVAGIMPRTFCDTGLAENNSQPFEIPIVQFDSTSQGNENLQSEVWDMPMLQQHIFEPSSSSGSFQFPIGSADTRVSELPMSQSNPQCAGAFVDPSFWEIPIDQQNIGVSSSSSGSFHFPISSVDTRVSELPMSQSNPIVQENWDPTLDHTAFRTQQSDEDLIPQNTIRFSSATDSTSGVFAE